MLYQLSENNLSFPDVNLALTEPNGLLAIGGDLQPNRLVKAYQNGIFPWFSDGEPILWWSPDPRAVIFIDDLRINKTLRKALRKSDYHITLNKSFEQVIHFCADAPFRQQETWISSPMQKAYINLHQQGFAHSIEVWQNESLIGGLYGVAINGFFSGESMFYKKSNASKFALITICQHLQSIGIQFIDCQLLNPFLTDMGAIDVSRNEFLALKQETIKVNVPSNFWQPKVLSL